MHLKHIFPIRSLPGIRNHFHDVPISIVIDKKWRKSSFSTYNGNCVEVGSLSSEIIGVRDTGHREMGPVLAFTADEWRAFLGGVKTGRFDLSR